jgi:hypothetical protein
MNGETLISGALLQEQMLSETREDRLADEPLGPQPPQTHEDHRQNFEALDITAGDTVEMVDGVEATIDGIVPALGDCGLETEKLVHYSGVDPEHGEFRDAMPAWMVADDLWRGDRVLK